MYHLSFMQTTDYLLGRISLLAKYVWRKELVHYINFSMTSEVNQFLSQIKVGVAVTLIYSDLLEPYSTLNNKPIFP